MLLAKVWYFLSTGGQAFVLPYFNVYFDALGFSKEQIGALSALRPWLSAPCGVLLCGMADKLHCHTALLVFTFAVSLFLRCLLLLVPPHFLAVAALVLLSDCIGAPVGAIVDATVVGACKSDGDYGKHRMWASAAWGVLSVVAGSLVAQKGLGAGFIVYLSMSIPCIYIALRIREDAAAEKAANDAAAAGDSTANSSQLKCQPPSQTPAAKGAAAATAAGACAEETEELTARLLTSTPDSSCYGGSDSLASSPRRGSCLCSPARDMRCASPFSRFCDKSFDAEGHTWQLVPSAYSSASPTLAALPGKAITCQQGAADALAVVGVSSSTTEPEAASAGLIKAWYESEQQPEQPVSARPEHDTSPSETNVDADASTAPATANTKQSAKLDSNSLANSQQLQTSYSLVDWHSKKGGEADVTADGICTAAVIKQHNKTDAEHELSPLLNLDTKQPLSPDTAVTASAGAVSSEVTIKSLLATPAVLVFLWRALIIGLGLGAIGNFVFLHVEELGGTGTLFGLMLFFNIVTEFPAFMFQSTILEKLPVPFVFNASMLLLALRLAGYGFLPLLHSPWPVLGLELLHGVTFATSWGAGIVHCKRLAPPHLNASMQGLFSSLYSGVGSGLGALLGGILMQELGGTALFFICSCVVLCGWFVGYVVEIVLVRRSRATAATRM